MKKLITIILTAVTAALCLGLVGCGDTQNQNPPPGTVSYYGIIEKDEASGSLLVNIPGIGLCELPGSSDGMEINIALKVQDLIRIDFEADEVAIMECYPARFSTPAKSISVLRENVELSLEDGEYLLTVDYTADIKNDFLAYEKHPGDTVYFIISEGIPGSGSSPSAQKLALYCTATVVNTSRGRLTLKLNLNTHPCHDFLASFAERRARLSTEFESDKEPLLNFFDIQKSLTLADIQSVILTDCSGSTIDTYLRPYEHKYSTKPEDIEAIFDWLKSLNNHTLTEVTEQETNVEGGSSKILTVNTRLGKFKLTESAGAYLHVWDKHFAARNCRMPDIVGEDITLRFDYSIDTQLNLNKWGEPSATYDLKLSEITFKLAKRSYDEMLDVGFMLHQDVGAFKLFSPKLFYHESSGSYYEITGDKDFSEIFDSNPSFSEKDKANIAVLKEAYGKTNNPRGADAFVVNYYGEYESGAIVAMMTRTDMSYSEALWTETVAGELIEYNNGNRITVLYNGDFCNLETAYNNGYLTKDDIAEIKMKHRIFYYGLLDAS